MTIEVERRATISSKDVDDLWVFLNDKSLNALNGNTLNELFDNQQQFIAFYNEWEALKKMLITLDEAEYIQYMEYLESSNPNIAKGLTEFGFSFDNQIKTSAQFVTMQANMFDSVFPFASSEIVGWDSNNFILRDSIYYSTTGKRAVFFLARLDNQKELT